MKLLTILCIFLMLVIIQVVAAPNEPVRERNTLETDHQSRGREEPVQRTASEEQRYNTLMREHAAAQQPLSRITASSCGIGYSRASDRTCKRRIRF
jgi:hypothetical protein